MYDTAQEPGGRTKVDAIRTAHGVKDTYFETFLDSILSAGGRFRGKKAAELSRKKAAELGTNARDLYSPIWRIKGGFIHFFVHLSDSHAAYHRP
jgi:hypothetical protein